MTQPILYQPTLKDIFTEAANLIALGKSKNVKIATAESCTGGLIGAAITAIDGSSSVFKGGIIAYENAVKTSLLDIKPNLIIEFGAVSEPVCIAMAKGALKALEVDLAVSVTGIAGPKGGTINKPVGTVWMGLAVQHQNEVITKSHLYNFGTIGRNKVRDLTVYSALKTLQTAIYESEFSH